MSEIVRGKTYYDRLGAIRVMAVADGYAMCRRPRCLPFVVSVKNLQEGYIHFGGQRHDLATELQPKPETAEQENPLND